MKKIFEKLLEEMNNGRDAVIVTIIRHSGSTPRESGTQMLVDNDGNMTGTIGGGAVENEAGLKAIELIKEKRSDIHEYILKVNSVENIGMVCGGNITAYFQFVSASDNEWKNLSCEIIRRIEEGIPGILGIYSDGRCWDFVNETADAASGSQNMKNPTDGGEERLFNISLPIGERAIIFGAGHCAKALAPVLTNIGFRVTMFDDRPELLTKERYPDAEELVCGDFEHIERYFDITDRDYLVIMTSGHTYDYVVEKTILANDFAYLGVIGSRKKTAVINRRLREDNVSEDKISLVHTPIGLPILAETPEEIAISIAAEMIKVRAEKRQTGITKEKACPMHSPEA